MSYLAAMLIVAGVALYVAAPLFGSRDDARKAAPDRELERQIHDRELAVHAIRELEFDRLMDKLSSTDYRLMRAQLDSRALAAMTAIERLRAKARERPAKPPPRPRPQPAPANDQPPQRAITFCPQCGAKVRQEGSFCTECGTSLNPARTMAPTESR